MLLLSLFTVLHHCRPTTAFTGNSKSCELQAYHAHHCYVLYSSRLPLSQRGTWRSRRIISSSTMNF